MNSAIAPSNGIGKLLDILRFNVRKFISVKQPAILPVINFLFGQISFRKQSRRRNESSKTATKNSDIYFASGGKSFAWRFAMEYMSAAEVYLGKSARNLSLDILPFEEDKLPQNTKEAF